MLETNTAGHVSADQRYRAYGRQRDSGPVVTDHRFTGQKYDSTGLYYDNARYYDPALGAFISPDTIVPRPGGSRTNLLDYNRYMYGLGNPVKFRDPSGHCSTLADGSRDLDNDAGCWHAADEVYKSWAADPNYWSGGFDITADDWLANVATQGYATETFIQGELHRFWAPQFQAWGVQHPTYNPAPRMHPAPEYAPVNLPNPCNFWDCPAIVLDLASLGTSIAQTGAAGCTATGVGAPVCGPATAYLTTVDIGLNAISIGYESYKYMQGDGTLFDLSVTLTDRAVKPTAEILGAGASATPGIGVAYDVVMLGYDIFVDPFVRTPGQVQIAR